MHISIQITINIVMIFCHTHLCTNDYPYSYGFFRNPHLRTNDYPYCYGFLSCKYLYKWVSILLWVYVMYIFVLNTIHIIMVLRHVRLCINDYPYSYGFCHAHLCTNEYFVPNFFQMRFCKIRFFCLLAFLSAINWWGRAPWCLSSPC